MADELPPEERADFLARECAGDGALLAEVAWMRKAAASDTTLHALRWEMAEPPELAGEQLCADAARDYRVLRRIGPGGMGGLLSDGQPFLAIEYVEGEHIDAWCREHSPDLRRRLELFLQVCAGRVRAQPPGDPSRPQAGQQ